MGQIYSINKQCSLLQLIFICIINILNVHLSVQVSGHIMKDFAAIIINYNSSQFTANCIRSILDKTADTLNYEIIVVDNGSSKEDYHWGGRVAFITGSRTSCADCYSQEEKSQATSLYSIRRINQYIDTWGIPSLCRISMRTIFIVVVGNGRGERGKEPIVTSNRSLQSMGSETKGGSDSTTVINFWQSMK